MLKAMRKNLKSLKPILWIVVAAFAVTIFAVWGGGGRLGEKASEDTIAQVGKAKIYTEEYVSSLRRTLDGFKKQYGSINPAIINQLNIPFNILSKIIQQRLLLQIANELGLKATDSEVKERILSFPAFQRDGVFVGFEDYKRILDYNHIPIEEFEAELRQDIIIDKVIKILTAGLTVSEEEVWQNYKKQNESAKIEYLVLDVNKIDSAEKLSEDELREHFARFTGRYKIPEQRTSDYIFIKNDDVKKLIKIEDKEIDKYYRDNKKQFEEPEKVKVARIWLPFDNQDKNQASELAKDIINRLRNRESFSDLAHKFSKDDKASSGGDWGYLDWKTLSEKEVQAINTLEQEKFSDPIETETGISILKVTEKTKAFTRPLAEVRETIVRILEDQKARKMATEKIQRIEKAARKDKSLERAVQKEGLTILSTGPQKAGDPLYDIDSSGAISDAAFALKENEISSPVYTMSGVGLVQLKKIEKERAASFEEARSQVEKDIVDAKKKEKAHETLKKLKTSLKDNWASEAPNHKLDYKSVEAHKHDQYLSQVGEIPEIDELIFSIPIATVSDPVEVENGFAIFRVLERKQADRSEFEKNKLAETESLLADRRSSFLLSYLNQAQKIKTIQVNYDLFLKINSEIISRYSGE